MCESGRPAQASRQPAVSTSVSDAIPSGASQLRGHGDDGPVEGELEDGVRVMRHAAVAVARVGVRDARGEHGHAVQRARGVRRHGRGGRSVPEPAARPDDPGPDRADGGIEALGRGPEERGRDAYRRVAAAEAGPDGDRLDAGEPQRVGQPDREGAARQLHVRAAGAGEPGEHREHLAVERAADDGEPAELGRERRRPPRHGERRAGRACTGASSRARPAPPRGRARASGSRAARRSRRSRGRAAAPAR